MSRATAGEESCNSRHLSWLMKSCFPNPQQQQQIITSTTTINILSKSSSISALPDDLLLECLTRASLSSLPTLPLVCRRWSLLINSPSFLLLRTRLRLLRPTLFSLLNPHRRLASILSPLSFSFSLSVPSHARLAAVGPRIYVIGRSSTVRCDTWTGNMSLRSQMIFARKKFAVAVVAGKIYVAGGASAVEEYDPGNDTWRVVAHVPRRRYGCLGTSAEGIFYIIGGLKIGKGGTEAHHVYTSSMDLYDVERGTWLRSRTVPGGGCVVAACSANSGHVYILASHAVELSFWRFDGRHGRPCFGEWQKLKAPPRIQAQLDSTMRFSCVGVENKVVLLQVTTREDLINTRRRSAMLNSVTKQACLVTVYDCDGGEWSRVPDMPPDVASCAPPCVCVEC